jgi:hypothetical protein
MSLVDVDAMEAEIENKKIAVEKKEKIIKKVRKTPVNKKPVYQPPQLKFTEEELDHFEKQINKKDPADNEVKDGIRDIIIKGLGYPARDKKDVLQEKLKKSKYINKYIDEKINCDLIDGLNPNAKFAVVYSYHYLDTIFS